MSTNKKCVKQHGRSETSVIPADVIFSPSKIYYGDGEERNEKKKKNRWFINEHGGILYTSNRYNIILFV